MIRSTVMCLVAAAAPAASAQTSELYITQPYGDVLSVVQGGAVVRAWNMVNEGETAIAVSGTVRAGGNNLITHVGHEYDLDGNPLGRAYGMPMSGNWPDGTTDGVNSNYSVQHNGDYYLYRFNRDWGFGERLFSVGSTTAGVTYDVATGTLWVSNTHSRLIRNFRTDGTLLSSFTATEVPFADSLAMDPADGTLWIGGIRADQLYQYDRSGTFLGSVTVSNLGPIYGMEFSIVPAPDSAVLLLLGAAGAVRRRR